MRLGKLPAAVVASFSALLLIPFVTAACSQTETERPYRIQSFGFDDRLLYERDELPTAPQAKETIYPILIKSLSSDQPLIQASAADALAWYRAKNTEIIPKLLPLLKHQSPEVRRSALVSILHLHWPGVYLPTQPIIEALRDSDLHVRRTALRLLERAPDQPVYDGSISEIVKEFEPKDVYVDLNTDKIILLKGRDPASYRPHIVDDLSSKDPIVSAMAREIVAEIGIDLPSIALDLLQSASIDAEDVPVARAFNAFGDEAVNFLIHTLSTGDSAARARAAMILGHFSTNYTAIVRALALSLKEDDADVRHSAIRALSRIWTDSPDRMSLSTQLLPWIFRQFRPWILESARRADPDVLAHYVWLLSRKDIIPARNLVEMTSSHSVWDNLLAALTLTMANVSLSRGTTERIQSALSEGLREDDIRVQAAVIRAVWGNEKAIEDLLVEFQSLLRHEEPDLRIGAALGLASIGVDSDLVRQLVLEAISSEEELVQDRAVSVALDISSRGDSEKVFAGQFVRSIFSLQDPSESGNLLHRAMSSAGDTRRGFEYLVEAALSTMADEKEFQVGAAVLSSAISWEWLEAAFSEAEADKDDVTSDGQESTILAQPLADAVIAAMQHPDAQVRRNAASVLGPTTRFGGFSSTESVRALADALNDPDPSVRTSAAVSLRKLASGVGVVDSIVTDLVEALTDRNLAVRREATDALTRFAYDDERVQVLITALKDIRLQVRRGVALALSGVYNTDELSAKNLDQIELAASSENDPITQAHLVRFLTAARRKGAQITGEAPWGHGDTGPDYIPELPWPPPRSTTTYRFDELRTRLPDMVNSNLRDVYHLLRELLNRSGIYDLALFKSRGGFTLVTPPRLIDESGKPLPSNMLTDDWSFVSLFTEADALWRTIFFGPGETRQFWFVVTDRKYVPENEWASSWENVKAIWRDTSGLDLPENIARMPFEGRNCYVLIFHFDHADYPPRFVTSGPLQARDYMMAAGLLDYFGPNRGTQQEAE